MKYYLYFFGWFLVIWLTEFGLNDEIKWVYWSGCGLAGILIAISDQIFKNKNKL